MGAGLGRGEYLDFGLFPIRNQQFFSIHLDGAKKTNMIFNRFFFPLIFKAPPFLGIRSNIGRVNLDNFDSITRKQHVNKH